MNPAVSAAHRRIWGAIGLVLLAASVGCYDAAVLMKARQESHDRVQMDEVDLGTYRITLPHTLGESIDCVVDFHVFGQVMRGDREAIDAALQMRGAELRSAMLVAVRSMDDRTFEEPKLTALRKSIAEVVNGVVGRRVVKSVGFYRFSFFTI